MSDLDLLVYIQGQLGFILDDQTNTLHVRLLVPGRWEPKPIEHGDYAKGYKRGCTCTLCRLANRAYHRAYQQRRRDANRPR